MSEEMKEEIKTNVKDADEPKLSIKINNSAVKTSCGICGNLIDPPIGPELFLADTWDVVCTKCGDRYSPELSEMLRGYWVEKGLNE